MFIRALKTGIGSGCFRVLDNVCVVRLNASVLLLTPLRVPTVLRVWHLIVAIVSHVISVIFWIPAILLILKGYIRINLQILAVSSSGQWNIKNFALN